MASRVDHTFRAETTASAISRGHALLRLARAGPQVRRAHHVWPQPTSGLSAGGGSVENTSSAACSSTRATSRYRAPLWEWWLIQQTCCMNIRR